MCDLQWSTCHIFFPVKPTNGPGSGSTTDKLVEVWPNKHFIQELLVVVVLSLGQPFRGVKE